jgi:hypothetical protein
MPPSVAGSTLTHAFQQATTKRHFEQLEMQFPAGCCTNITWHAGSPKAFFLAGPCARSSLVPPNQVIDIKYELHPEPTRVRARAGALKRR